jgi:hypothetical protein
MPMPMAGPAYPGGGDGALNSGPGLTGLGSSLRSWALAPRIRSLGTLAVAGGGAGAAGGGGDLECFLRVFGCGGWMNRESKRLVVG